MKNHAKSWKIMKNHENHDIQVTSGEHLKYSILIDNHIEYH